MNAPVSRSFGDLMRAAREAAGRGVPETAAAAGLDVARLEKIEAGSPSWADLPTIDEAKAVCSALGTSTEALLAAMPPDEPPPRVLAPGASVFGWPLFPGVAHLVLQRASQIPKAYLEDGSSSSPEGR